MKSEPSVSSLGGFLRHSGADYRVFDMGRRVIDISHDDFESFEQAFTPYPMPFQRSALFGVMFWHPQAKDRHYVWFLRFPLDEQGLLLQASRDEFLAMVLDRVGECMLAAADGQTIEGALKDSPYSFNPREDKLAAFNAKATHSLALPASQFYANAHSYFSGKQPLENWPSLGMQGVADVAVRLEQSADIQALITLLPALPAQPFQILTTFLEHVKVSSTLTEAFAEQLEKALQAETVDVALVCACLRAASHSQAQGLLATMVEQCLHHEVSREIEVLAVLAGRCWPVLQDPHRCQLFIEKLAHNEAGYDGFSHLLADLIYLPAMRLPVMAALRNPERSAALSQYVGQLFGH